MPDASLGRAMQAGVLLRTVGWGTHYPTAEPSEGLGEMCGKQMDTNNIVTVNLSDI